MRYIFRLSSDNIVLSKVETLEYLKKLGFKVNPNIALARTTEEAIDYYRTWLEKVETLDYGCDGIVVKVNRFDYQNHLEFVGASRAGLSHYVPHRADSHKFLTIPPLSSRLPHAKCSSFRPVGIYYPRLCPTQSIFWWSKGTSLPWTQSDYWSELPSQHQRKIRYGSDVRVIFKVN